MGQGSFRSLTALLLLALAEGAAGCGGGAARRPPAPAQRLQEEQARAGAKAWAKGDLQAAIAAQERALLAARSVEDEEGIALRVLDLAALHRAAGEAGEASAALAELLAEPPPLPYPGRLRSEAARLAGLLELDAGDAAGGARWAARALELCDAIGCDTRGAILNLQARAAHLGGDREGAIRIARAALTANREAGDDVERANSSRIVADAQLALGRPAAAAAAYADALELDKRLGLEPKIFLDLVGLGRSAQGQGRAGEARGWFQRARAAALAGGDEAGATEAAALLEALPPPR